MGLAKNMSKKVRIKESVGNMERIAQITRNTNETKINMTLNLDGSGKANIHTGIGFFDHMLNSFARHGFFDLDLTVPIIPLRIQALCWDRPSARP